MVLTTVMSSQLENKQSIEMENENIVEEILTEEKGNETSHPDRQPEVQDVLDSIEHVPIEYLSLIKEFNWKSIKEMMEVLFTCDCCERHQKNKPNISDLENGHRADYPPSNRKFSEDDCQCVCRQEARDFCRIINDPDYFDLYYGRVARYSSPVNRDVSDENSEFLEPDVGYSNIYHRDIELGCMCEDCLKEEHKEDKYENRCIECGEDMGLENPRQLCGKTYCRNITERDDDGSIS
jgi:hypothetical protein